MEIGLESTYKELKLPWTWWEDEETPFRVYL